MRGPVVEWMCAGWSPGTILFWFVPGIGGMKKWILVFGYAVGLNLGRNSLLRSAILFAASLSALVKLFDDSVFFILVSRVLSSSCWALMSSLLNFMAHSIMIVFILSVSSAVRMCGEGVCTTQPRGMIGGRPASMLSRFLSMLCSSASLSESNLPYVLVFSLVASMEVVVEPSGLFVLLVGLSWRSFVVLLEVSAVAMFLSRSGSRLPSVRMIAPRGSACRSSGFISGVVRSTVSMSVSAVWFSSGVVAFSGIFPEDVVKKVSILVWPVSTSCFGSLVPVNEYSSLRYSLMLKGKACGAFVCWSPRSCFGSTR